MRSVLTILLFLIILGAILLYTLKSKQPGEIEEENQGHSQAYGRGWENGGGKGGGWRWKWYGILPCPSYTYEVQEEPEEVVQPVDSPCSTDLDCPTGHCSMFGICTNGLSL